jgi:energy-coupling factor transporter ATP-binding protein EcfA2
LKRNDSDPDPLLTESQKARLLAWSAWWEEGEARFAHWEMREEDEETAEAFAQILRQSDFAGGGDLSPGQLDRLCRLARRLSEHRNLNRRLYADPARRAALNALLRRLLFGADALPARLSAFMQQHGVGAQTASLLLCAAFPTRFPLITPGALAPLELTPEQYQRALETAAERYALAEMRPGDPLHALLRDMILYEAVRETLGTPTYIELHRLLRAAPQEANAATAPAQVQEPRAVYAVAPSPVPAGNAERTASLSENDLLTTLESAVREQGFSFPPLMLRNYYIALKTRPFVLLYGISGMGKTRLTQLFADALTGDPASQYLLLPVRPDWTDPTPLLGYLNLLASPEGRYVSTRFLAFLQQAARPENAGRAFFVCLDEMNLARVEHYFADLLSAMETPEKTLYLENGTAVRIPPNLFITGSVNVDESAFAFSRKVLDRANAIEFSDADFSALLRRETSAPAHRRKPPPAPSPERLRAQQALFLASRVPDVFAAQRRLQALRADLVPRTLQILTDLNRALSAGQISFGYRVRDETLIYLANSFDGRGRGLLDANLERNWQTALDLQILQRALPRLSGAQEQIETSLRETLLYLLPECEPLLTDASGNLPRLEERAAQAAFPRSARKLCRLYARVQREGYAMFYDS